MSLQSGDNNMLGILAGGLISVFSAWNLWLSSRWRDLGNQVTEMKAEVPKIYVTKDDSNRGFDRIETRQIADAKKNSENFARLFDRLDGKKDKS